MKPTQWPPPCPQCGSVIKQQTEWSTDAQNFKQTCHEAQCGFHGDWEPYPPGRSLGYSYAQIKAAHPKRVAALLDAKVKLGRARKLSLHSPPIRDAIGHLIEGIDECLSRLGL